MLPALFKYGYEGPVYCTPPTRDLMSLCCWTRSRWQLGERTRRPPYESRRTSARRSPTASPLKYGETTDIAPDIRLTFQNAGHILGSAVCHFHIGDGLYNIAFTGDMKFERTWLFNATVNKFPRLETLVIESTYGGYHDIQPSRMDAANQLSPSWSGRCEHRASSSSRCSPSGVPRRSCWSSRSSCAPARSRSCPSTWTA